MNNDNNDSGMHQKYREQIEEYNRTHPRTNSNTTDNHKQKSFSYTEQESTFFINRESNFHPVILPIIIFTVIAIALLFVVFSINNKLAQFAEVSMAFFILSIFFDVGLGLILDAIYKDKKQKECCIAPVNALVIKMELSSYTKRSSPATPVYKYTYNDVVYTSQEHGYRGFDLPSVGDEEVIYINPSNPTEFRSTRRGSFIFTVGMGAIFMSSIIIPLICILSGVLNSPTITIIRDLILTFSFVIIPIIIGIVLIILPAHISKSKRNGCNTKVKAVIVNYIQEEKRNEGIFVYTPIYEYSYNGVTYQAKSSDFSDEPRNIGHTCKIYINKDNPSEFFDSESLLVSLSKPVGIMFILLSIMMITPYIIDAIIAG